MNTEEYRIDKNRAYSTFPVQAAGFPSLETGKYQHNTLLPQPSTELKTLCHLKMCTTRRLYYGHCTSYQPSKRCVFGFVSPGA